MKTGLLTFYHIHHYGAMLQAYATERAVASLGSECEIIDYYVNQDNTLFQRPTGLGSAAHDAHTALHYGPLKARYERFEAFSRENLNISGRRYQSLEELRQAELPYDVLLSGSDQIWNPKIFPDGRFDPVFFGAFSHKRKIAYAPSFGIPRIPDGMEEELRTYLEGFYGDENHEHMVFPGMVYLSWPTELGTLYTRAELAALRQCCDVHGLFLYLDGARLGSALTSPDNDLTLPDLAALTHAFTIGGTKNGALFGEALVLTRPMPHFRWHMKQRGAVLAKGRLLGLQFQALLEDGLYFDLARRANELAFRLRDGVAALGYPFPVASPSNQQFPVLPNETVAKLQEMGYEFETDHPVDANHTCIRLVTSWATPETAVEDFLRDLAGC